MVLQMAGQLAERENADVAKTLQGALEADGCRVLLNVDVRRVEATASGLKVHPGDTVLEGSDLLLAKPNTDDRGLNTVGLALDDQGM
jgi:pyruvate/2-oxoglutarate dehydrogenase complex dihydrolipoamide dehydrogenase (E3) component